MKLVRTATAVAAGAALVFAGTAGAAVKKPLPCNLITDDKGDADIDGNGTGNDSALDVTSVDFGSDKKTVTIVLRVAKASPKSAVVPVGATKFQTNFTVGGVAYFASVVSDSDITGAFGTVGTGSNTILTTPPAVIDTVTNEVRISVPTADFPTPFKTGDAFSAITARTSGAVVKIATPVLNGSTGGVGVDSATAEVVYKAGTKTCVTVGK